MYVGLSESAVMMKGTVGFYLWVCAIAYFTRSGSSLPILGNELVNAEEEELGIPNWIQGEETPLMHQYWSGIDGEEQEGQEAEVQGLSPDSDKRQHPGGKRQHPGGKRQYPGGKRQWPGGKRQWPGGKRQYLAGKRQFVGGDMMPSPELRQHPGGKRQYLAGKRQYLAGKRSEEEQDLFPMEIRQHPGGKRQYLAGNRQYLAGKRQHPGGKKRQFPGGKRQFPGGEPLEQEAAINKRFVPEGENVDFLKLAHMYELNNDILINEEDLEIEDLLDDIMVDTRPEMEVEEPLMSLLGNADSEDALAIDLTTLLHDRNEANW